MLKVDLTYVGQHIDEKAGNRLIKRIGEAHKGLKEGSLPGNAFRGWLDLPNTMEPEVDKIQTVAKRLAEKNDVLLVIGIGGSYLGAKAAIEALRPYFSTDKKLEVIFVGNHISSEYMADLRDYLKEKSFAINVISKSGTTTEPALAFRVFKALLEEKVGEDEARQRIVATTDKEKGALRQLAEEKGYDTFVIPDDVGGRYSVLTAVGLLPIACAGIDIDAMLKGAKQAAVDFDVVSEDNPVYRYVMARNALYEQGKKIEMFVHYEPKLQYFSEWWKQLFGESEGKDNKGLFISSAGFTTDLHSLGQYIQEGERHLFETVVNINEPLRDFTVSKTDENLDNLNYLSGMSVDAINKQAMQGTLLAHMDGGAPSIVINIERMDARHFGYLVYFFELGCALSGHVLEVNPFNQPGVEAYKENMFALLEKPGFEDKTKAIKKRLKKTRG